LAFNVGPIFKVLGKSIYLHFQNFYSLWSLNNFFLKEALDYWIRTLDSYQKLTTCGKSTVDLSILIVAS